MDVVALDHQEALAQTAELLQQDEVVIYEAAFRYAKLFIFVVCSLSKAATILAQGAVEPPPAVGDGA